MVFLWFSYGFPMVFIHLQLQGATTALPHVAILALNLALGSPSPECLALAVRAQAAQLRQRLGEEAATVPLKTAPWLSWFWANYNDLSATSLESWLVREIIPKMALIQVSEIL